MYSCVISCLKACFHRRQGCHAVDVADSVIDDEENRAENIYKVDVLQGRVYKQNIPTFVKNKKNIPKSKIMKQNRKPLRPESKLLRPHLDCGRSSLDCGLSGFQQNIPKLQNI
nr:AlNc14C541G12105 [Albugo laibachii Nc14]|eukprot:CCA27467.1 AlNc14C541G12105 [Albugo laibachii Nc14]